MASWKRCRLWSEGVPSPFLKVELWPRGNTVIFFKRKKNLYFYLNSSIFKTQWGGHAGWPVCNLWPQCSQTGWSHGQLEVPGTGWLLLSSNSLNPSAWFHPDMTSCMTCVFPVSAPRCMAHQGGPGLARPNLAEVSGEEHTCCLLAKPSSSRL